MTSRRRVAASLAAVAALVGAVVLGGTFAAQADGGLEFTSPGDGATLAYTSTPVQLTGTAPSLTPNSVSVWDYSSGGSPDPVCTTTPAADGTWSCPDSIGAGTHDYRVFQGAFSDTVLFSVALPTPSVTGPATVVGGGTIELVGENGYAGAVISAVVTTPNEPGLTCSTTPLPSDGAWSGCDIAFDAELVTGTTATVTVTQTFGALSTSTTHDVDIVNPTSFDILSPDLYVAWQSGPFTVSGTAPDDDLAVSVELDGGPGVLAMLLGTTWSAGFGAYPAPGSHSVTAYRDAQEVTVGFDVILPAPAVANSGPSTAAVGWSTYSVQGTTTYPGASTRAVLYGGQGSSQDSSPASTTVCTTAGSDFTCDVDISALSARGYTVQVEHYLSADPDLDGEFVELEFRLTGTAPLLDCVYTSNGGILVTTEQDLGTFSIYRLGLGSEGSDGGSSGSEGEGGGSSGGGGEPDSQGYCNGAAGATFPPGTSFDFDLLVDCPGAASCALSSLPPGDYEVWHRFEAATAPPGSDLNYHSYKFTIPSAPTITTVASVSNSVLLRGAGTPGDTVRLERPNGSTACTATVAGTGRWACTVGKSSTTRLRAITTDAESGGMSAYSAFRTIPVYVAPADTPLTLVTWFLEFGGDFMDLKPGDTFSVNVSGMPEGTDIEVWIHSTPRLLGTAVGTGLPMTMELVVPADIESGDHEIEMIGTTPLGTKYYFTSDAHVTGGVAPTPDGKEHLDESDEAGSGGGGGFDRADPASPSSLSESVAPLGRIIENPVAIAVAGGLALALLFLVALPTELLNSSLSSNTSRLGRAYGAVDGALTKAQDWFIRVTRSRALAAAVVVVLVAIVYGFVDPGFGFDLVSLRLVLSLAIAFFLLSFGASWVSGLIIHRRWGASGVIAIQPSIILFAIVGVIVARILDFSPGFLVGIAIGLELIQASKQVSARAVFVQLGVVTGFALAAWVVYSLFTPGDDFAGMLLQDTMVAVTAEGLTGALIAIFPLKFLDGRELWEVSKRLWAVAFLVIATAFALLVLPTAIEGTEVGDYGVWLGVFAVFGLLSLAVWLVFARAAAREEAAEAERESVDS